MAGTMLRIKLAWTGFQGSPGYSSFYFREFSGDPLWTPTQAQVDAAAGKVTAFATGLKNTVPAGVTLQVQSDCELIQDTDGSLVDVFSAAQQAPQASTAPINVGYSAASGVVINWRTAVVRKNRRIRGRTFIVPVQREVYEANGTIAEGSRTGITALATTLADGSTQPDLGVWARPTRVKNPATGQYTGETLPDGEWAVVRSVNVPDLAAVLRSRRD